MLRSLFPLSFFLSPFEDETYWNGLPFPSPGNLPDPGIEPGSPTLQADSLPYEPPGKLLFLKELLKFLLFSLLHCHLAPSECHLLQLSWTLAFSSETISSSIWSHRWPYSESLLGSPSWPEWDLKSWARYSSPWVSTTSSLVLSSTGPGILVALGGGPPLSQLLTLFFLFFCLQFFSSVFFQVKSVLSFHTQVKCYLFCVIFQWLKLFLCSCRALFK